MKTFYKDKNKKKSEEDIKKDIQNIEKTKSFVIWVQEFSKKNGYQKSKNCYIDTSRKTAFIF